MSDMVLPPGCNRQTSSLGQKKKKRVAGCHAYCSKSSPVACHLSSPRPSWDTRLSCGHQALSYGGSLVMMTLSSTVHDNRLGIAVPLDRLSFAVRPSGAASLLRRR